MILPSVLMIIFIECIKAFTPIATLKYASHQSFTESSSSCVLNPNWSNNQKYHHSKPTIYFSTINTHTKLKNDKKEYIFETSKRDDMVLFANESDKNDEQKNTDTSVLYRAYDASFGRLFRIAKYTVRKVVVKPYQKVKSYIWKDISVDEQPIDEEDFISHSSNLALDQVNNDVDVQDPGKEGEGIQPNFIREKLLEQSNDIRMQDPAKEGESIQQNVVREKLLDSAFELKPEIAKSNEKPYFCNETIPEIVQNNKIDTDDITENAKEVSSTVAEKEKFAVVVDDNTQALPKGNKWAIAAPGVDFTGEWKMVISDEFKEQYDKYLFNLGQPSIVRSVAVSIVEMTKEEIVQKDQGRELCIKGKNLRGVWERTLIASGSDYGSDHDPENNHLRVPIITADNEKVNAESWWENNGTVHTSWLLGVKKYGGGDFSAKRYLEDENTLVCESAFHPKGEGKEKAEITWKFSRL